MCIEKKVTGLTGLLHKGVQHPWIKEKTLFVGSVNMPQYMRNFYGCRVKYSFFLHKFKANLVRVNMNFNKMITEIGKDGVRAFRPAWGEGEMMWKKDGVLVHNTPYWGGELINQYLGGYPYVCEIEDTVSDDWVIIREDEEEKKKS